MIAKAVKGRGFRGALAYDLGKDHGRILDTNMAGETVRELSAEFGSIRKLRPNLDKAVLHVSLSAAPGENMTDAQWQAIGRQYLAGMGFTDNQYLITRHTDTEHEHIHILANRISHAGLVVSDSRDYQRQEVLMRTIERDYGLQQLAPSRESDRRAPTRGEIEKQIRTRDVSTRVQLQQLADAAVARSGSYSEYRDHLEAAGVELVPILQQGGARLSGLIYRLDNVTMKGSDLGKGYSPAGLAQRGVSYEQGRDAAAVRDRQEQEQPRAAGRAGPDDSRRQGAERRGAERDARAAGAGAGLAQQRGGQDPGRDTAGDPNGKRGPAKPDDGRNHQPAQLGDPGQAGQRRPHPRSQQTGLGALRADAPDRAADGSARQRVLALAQSTEGRHSHGYQKGGRELDAGADRGHQDEQRAGQAGQEQVAATALDPRAELARLERERADRVERVWARARLRQGRREQALRTLVQARPEATPDLVGTLQLKIHQQALLAWEAAKERATKLVAQAKQLAVRLLEAARPARVAAWARDLMQRERPDPSVVEQAPAVTGKAQHLLQPTRPADKFRLPDVSRYSLEDQYRLYNRIVDELKVGRQGSVQRVAAKVAKRLERRQTLARWSEADRPLKPQGLLAAFKKGQYDQAVKAYWQRQRRDRALVEQADKLNKKVLQAGHESENWAARTLHELQPEFVDRVERHVRGYNQRLQIKVLEAQQKLQRERGIEGPEFSR